MKVAHWVFATVVVSLCAAIAHAELEGAPSGREIVSKVNARDEGEFVARRLTMQLIDRRGKERTRETFGYRRYFGDEKRSVIYYLSPANIKDTGFLTFDYADPSKDDDQWLYLPATRKSRRISSSDRGDAFLGTDLSYEDMKKETKVSEEDYTFKTVGEEEGRRPPLLHRRVASDRREDGQRTGIRQSRRPDRFYIMDGAQERILGCANEPA